MNSFSLDLYRKSVSPGQNLFISPASVSLAVGLAYRGARGATAEELRTTMHYSASPEAYLPANAALTASINFAGLGRELRVTNALWLEEGLPLLPAFESDVTTHAKASIQRVSFRHDPEAARLGINSWVAAATNERINNLLHQGDITADTRAALVNSVYWKGQWQSPFSTEETKTGPFRGLNGERTPTSLMLRRANFQIVERSGVKVIQLPYNSGEIAMVILLPDAPPGLPRLESRLTDSGLKRLLDDLSNAPARDTILTLPKMHLEWRDDLVPALQGLGAATAFSDEADFSGMAVEPFPGEVPGATGLNISKIIHQTYVDVDEHGSEAAAATVILVDMVISGRKSPPSPPPIVFRADKPVLFLLRDIRTGLILFMGRYVQPVDGGSK